jgi:hypothetical protein
VRTDVKRWIVTERESDAASRVEMNWQSLMRMEESEELRRSCGHVLMKIFQRGVRHDKRDTCVWLGVKSQYACLQV